MAAYALGRPLRPPATVPSPDGSQSASGARSGVARGRPRRATAAITVSVRGHATALTASSSSVDPPTVIPLRPLVAHATAARATASGEYEVSGGICGGVNPAGLVRWRQNGESTAPGRTTER